MLKRVITKESALFFNIFLLNVYCPMQGNYSVPTPDYPASYYKYYMESAPIVECKLTLIPQQRDQLEQTLQAFAAACNYVWEYGKENNVSQQRILHEACYHSIRKVFGLPASLAIRAIARVATALNNQSGAYPFIPQVLTFDSRSSILNSQDWTVRLTLLNAREKFHLDVGNWQKNLLTGVQPTSMSLLKKYKSYFLQMK